MATDREYAALNVQPGVCGWKQGKAWSRAQVCGAKSRFRVAAAETINGEVCGIHRRSAAGLGYTTEPIRSARTEETQ